MYGKTMGGKTVDSAFIASHVILSDLLWGRLVMKGGVTWEDKIVT